MTSRAEHLEWCKRRARPYAEAGQLALAVASMQSDITKWEGGQMYEPEQVKTLFEDAARFRKTPAEMIHWVDGFG